MDGRRTYPPKCHSGHTRPNGSGNPQNGVKVIGKVVSASDGQPLLKNAKGKFIFVLDETGGKIALYSKGHPSLKGRSLFVNAASGTPEAAILIGNNPKTDNIGSLVREGYIVRTRADADTREARTSGR